MNSFMIKKLIAKDWYFNRYILLAYMSGGLLALAIMFASGKNGFSFGTILLVAAIISLGNHLVMGTVVQERTKQTLPFIMSLPVSIRDYTFAKVFANVTVFLGSWFVLSAILIIYMLSSSKASGGAVPIFTLMLLWMMLSYLVMLGTALVSESEGWTIVAMAVCNTAFMFVFMGLDAIEGIGGDLVHQPEVLWTSASLSVLGIELAAIAAILGLTFYLQGRKTDFL